MWLGFAAALIFNPNILDSVWQSFRGLPFIIQILLGILVLPVALGLWIWEPSLPFWLRLLLVTGLSFATIYTFFPRQP
jgi:hypothetical protein